MIVSLNNPFSGEHIYSWLIRAYKLSGYAEFLYFQKKLLFQDRFLHPNKLFSKSIEALVNQHCDRSKVLSNNTVAPLWQLSVGSLLNDKDPTLDAFSHMNEQQLFSFDTSWHSCKKCRQEDLTEFGVSYWHTQHQIPSAFMCYKHNTIIEKAHDPVKNLYTELLPSDIKGWVPVIKFPSEELKTWQSFVFKVFAHCIDKQKELLKIQKDIIEHLNLNQQRASKIKVICTDLIPKFEVGLGQELLEYLFRDYARYTRRGRPNILAAMFVDSTFISGRNPVYWLALFYWLRHELKLDGALA
ncbi:hypothetical protein N480_09710 [Pseudoalteromonas luteoviolacea S2607]|uniref:TniQ family protein n=1 Tax=Pseudoalteromonas luteoviolacea TaxID=43657 RepID=UPI0007B0626A|nr:TniQ family protein [Pseudoalteromonas luteoviolacea]KZN29034.1 hypothetical protein N480_09710 [Pseudoalteromonas luteoviolacea S2607]